MRNQFLNLIGFFALQFNLLACVSFDGGDAPWEVVRSEHFVFYTDGELDKAEATVRELEDFRQVVVDLTQMQPKKDQEPLTVFGLVDFNRYASLFVKHDGVLGYFMRAYDGQHLAVMKMEGPAQDVLKHEYVHYVQRHQGNLHYPNWYSEGFAEYLSDTRIEALGEYEAGLPAVLRAKTLLKNPWLDYHTLITKDGRKDYNRFYARAWFLTHFLVSKHPDGLDCYLKDYAKDPKQNRAEIFRRCLPFPLQDLDGKMNAYFKEPLISLKGKIRPYEGKIVREKTSIRERDFALAHAGLALETLRESDVEKLKSEYPEDPAFQGLVARFYLAENESLKAHELVSGKQASRLRADPEFARVEGEVYSSLARKNPEEAERWYGKAFDCFQNAGRLQPDFAQAMAGMAESGIESGKLSEAEAWSLLKQAIALRPMSGYNHFVEAKLYVREGKWNEAQETLDLLVGSEHPFLFPEEVRTLADHIADQLKTSRSENAH